MERKQRKTLEKHLKESHPQIVRGHTLWSMTDEQIEGLHPEEPHKHFKSKVGGSTRRSKK